MSVDWLRWGEEITRLYVTEDKSAEETIQIMRDQHNVKITIRQFKRQYSGLKKLRAHEWIAVKRVIQKRKADGKSSAVFLNNRQIDPNRLAREMRRYCGARGRASTDDETVIDLGIGTVNKHRLEIRTPTPQLTQCPDGSPRSPDITAGNATIFVEENTNECSPDLTDWILNYELESADLMTPNLGTADALYCAGTPNGFGPMINAKETQLDLLEDNEYRPVTNHQVQLTRPNPRWSTSIKMLSARPSPKLGGNLWSSNLSLPTILLLPQVKSVINSLENSTSYVGDNMFRLQQLVGNCSKIRHPRSNASPHLFEMQPTSTIVRLVSTLTNGFISRFDSTRLSDDVKALNSLIKTDRRLLHLVFSTAIHRCCNNTIEPDQFFSFCKWIVHAKVKSRLAAYLKKSPAISNAFAETILQLLPRRYMYGVPNPHETVCFIKVMYLYKDESVCISKRVCGLLLHAVITYVGSIDLVALLVARGAELDTIAVMKHGTEKHQGTPLAHAIYNGRTNIVKYFLELGPTQGWEPDRDDVCNGLIVALQIGYLEIAELLLSKGVDIRPQFWLESEKLEELLSKRERHRFPMLCRLLDDKTLGRTALARIIDAAASGSQALSKVLRNQEVVPETSLEIVLCQAINSGNSLAVQTLLQRGVDPNGRNRRTGNHIFGDVDPQLLLSTPLQLAIDHNADNETRNDILLLLIKAGAHADDDMLSKLIRRFYFISWSKGASLICRILQRYQSGIFGASALELAASEGDLAGCDLLLGLGAPINLYGSRGQTALQAASSEGQLLMVQFLLDEGADVNVPAHEDSGRTALQAALGGGHDDVAKCLLDAKADIRAPPAKKYGITVLEAFVQGAWVTSVDVVYKFRDWLSQGAPINRPDGDHGDLLHCLIISNNSFANECINIALEAGARTEDRDKFSCGEKTPLQVAAEVGNLDSVRLLLKYGALVNALPGNDFGRTALQAAVCGENPACIPAYIPAMVELLLSVGADVNAPPARTGGIAALQGAAISGDMRLAQILLDHGADVNAAPAAEEGRTAIEGAAEHGRLDMVRFLISVGAVGDFSRAIELAENEYHFTVADFLREQQDLSAGSGMGMDDMFGGDYFSQGPMQGFEFSQENLGNFNFQ
ncbi:ankyrin [Colletotrichum eremochloae]|nr:ankyrin [Colletotrichum eremochloae]